MVTRTGNDITVDPWWDAVPSVQMFYEHLLADTMRPKVYVDQSQRPPLGFDGVYILFDGESNDPTRNLPHHILGQTIAICHQTVSRAYKTIWIPFGSTIFAAMPDRSPLDLLSVNRMTPKMYFAAYTASTCVSHRENLYNQLVELARTYQLGEVHALGKCYGSHPETRRNHDVPRNCRNVFSKTIDLLHPYQFTLSLENTFTNPNYVTEKITLSFMAGAIPIYGGSTAVFKVYNSKAFIYLSEGQKLADVLLPVVQNPGSLLTMQRQSILNTEGLYWFSWHRDVQTLLKEQDKHTLKDEVYNALHIMRPNYNCTQ